MPMAALAPWASNSVPKAGERLMPAKRWISCRDAVDQQQSVIVEAHRCGVVMVAPPGAIAVLSDADVTALCTALCAAKEERRLGASGE
jgi:hypothetical protein